jgi:hypothetical protein
LVQCAAAIEEACAAAVAAENGNADQTIVIEDLAEIGVDAVRIGAGCWIRCAEGVENLKEAVRPDVVDDTFAIQAPDCGCRVQGPIMPGCPMFARSERKRGIPQRPQFGTSLRIGINGPIDHCDNLSHLSAGELSRQPAEEDCLGDDLNKVRLQERWFREPGFAGLHPFAGGAFPSITAERTVARSKSTVAHSKFTVAHSSPLLA